MRTSPDAQSEDVVRQDMAFHRQQAFEAIRDLLNSAYSEDFQAFDYFTADTLTPEDAPDFTPTGSVCSSSGWRTTPSPSPRPSRTTWSSSTRRWRPPCTWTTPQAGSSFMSFPHSHYHSVPLRLLSGLGHLFPGGPVENRRHLLHHFPRPGQRGFCQGGRRSSPAHRALLGALPPLRGITLAFLGADGAGCPVQLYAWKSLYNLTLGQGLFSLPWVDISAPCFWACCPCGSPPRAAPRCWPPCCPSQ